MANKAMLTTSDNPFNPFDDFHSWYSFDKENHYDSSERLDRIAKLTDEMTEIETEMEKERAIDEIIKHDIMNVYVKVSRDLIPVED